MFVPGCPTLAFFWLGWGFSVEVAIAAGCTPLVFFWLGWGFSSGAAIALRLANDRVSLRETEEDSPAFQRWVSVHLNPESLQGRHKPAPNPIGHAHLPSTKSHPSKRSSDGPPAPCQDS